MALEHTGVVAGIQRFSLDDGPGTRTNVFLKGCQLKCPWCHNPESISHHVEIMFRAAKCIACGSCAAACPVEGAITFGTEDRIDRDLCIHCQRCVKACPAAALEAVGQEMSVSQVMDEVMKDAIFYETSGGGVTFSGGEPTLQPIFLEALLIRAKELGLHTCIETNGCAGKQVWERLLPHLDLVLLDIKHMDRSIHKQVVGADNSQILQNAQMLSERVELILRTPLIPGFNDSEDFIRQLGEFAASLPRLKECHLIPYHEYGSPKYVMLGKKADIYQVQQPLGDKPQRYKALLEEYGLPVRVLK